jgi:hypothetical protein
MSRVLNVYQLMWGIEKYVVSGAVAGLTSVAWHDEDSAFTDGTTIHLPRPNALWNDEQLLLWRYKAEHELGHEDAVNACPHWKEVMVEKRKDKKYKDDGMLWWISNLISDHVQERNRIGEMIGRDDVLLNGRANFLKNVVFPEMEKNKAKLNDDEVRGSALFTWDSKARQAWNTAIVIPNLNKKVDDLVAKIEKESGVKLSALKNEKDVFEAAVKVRKLFPEVSADNNFMNAKPCAGDGKGKGDAKAEMDAARKKGKKSDKDGEKAKKTDSSIPFIPNGNHGDAPRPASYSYAKGEGSYNPRIPVPLSEGKRKYGFNHGNSGEHINKVKALLNRTNLPSKVRAYLMAMKREKLTTGWRSGRLDTSRLTDVLRGKDDMFRRKEPIRLVDSAVYLLVDSSGSMSGRPFQSACASAVMLAEALQGIGCSVEMAGFTEFGPEDKGGLIHDIWLPFGQRFVKENVLNKMGQMSNALSNNVDGENILFAYNRLKMQKETRKILIVLSDGEPSGNGPNGKTKGVGQFTADVCATIQKDKSVLLVGLGMSGYKPDRFYKNAYQVDAGQPLEPVLLGIVKDAVLR